MSDFDIVNQFSTKQSKVIDSTWNKKYAENICMALCCILIALVSVFLLIIGIASYDAQYYRSPDDLPVFIHFILSVVTTLIVITFSNLISMIFIFVFDLFW